MKLDRQSLSKYIIIASIANCLYVPWKQTNSMWTIDAGYGLIFAPPDGANLIDFPRVIISLAALGLIYLLIRKTPG